MNIHHKEYEELRADLRELKICQRQYYFIALTASGALLGLARIYPGAAGFLVLAPLILLLPCWVMFFDKATSVTRMTGYLRLIEPGIKDESSEPLTTGFETSLAIFRKWDSIDANVKDYEKERKFFYIVPWPFSSRYRYWKLNWYTYFLISIFCCIFSWYWYLNNGMDESLLKILVIAGIFVLMIWCATVRDLNRLVYGKSSYEHMYDSWKKSLGIK